jgi:hypothetical protein
MSCTMSWLLSLLFWLSDDKLDSILDRETALLTERLAQVEPSSSGIIEISLTFVSRSPRLIRIWVFTNLYNLLESFRIYNKYKVQIKRIIVFLLKTNLWTILFWNICKWLHWYIRTCITRNICHQVLYIL